MGRSDPPLLPDEQPRTAHGGEPLRHGGRRDTLLLAGFLLFIILFFSGALFQPGRMTLGRAAGDARNQFYGWRAFGFQQLREGRLPLWNPYEMMGMPFVASIQSALFYPLNWLCLVLPIGRGINLGIMLGMFLGGCFTFLWCRRAGIGRAGSLIAALAYTLGAPQLLRIYEGHWSFLAPMTWTPALMLCAEILAARPASEEKAAQKKPLLLATALGAFAVGMQLLGGNPQYAFYAGIAVSLYFLMRLFAARLGRRAIRRIGFFALMYLLGALLSGAQLLPALELLRVSSRQGQLTYAWISQYSLTPESLLTFLAPDIFGSDVGVQYWGRWNLWEMSAYVGAGAFALAMMGACVARRKAWPAAVLALLLLLLALGNHTPVLKFLYYAVPGFDLFRVPARFLAPLSLLLAFLAGLGADVLFRHETPAPRGARISLWVIAGAAIILITAGIFFVSGTTFARNIWLGFMNRLLDVGPGERLYFQFRTLTADFKLSAMREAGASLALSGIIIGIVAGIGFIALRRPQRALILSAALVALVAVDLWSFGRRYLVTFDPDMTGLTPGATVYLQAIPQPFRYARAGDFAFPECDGMINELACLEGIQPNVPARFRDLFWAFQGKPANTQTTAYSVLGLTPPLRMLNLQYLVQSAGNRVSQMPGLRAGVYRDERVRVDALPFPWPRAWLVHNYAVIEDPGQLLDILKQDSFAFEKLVLLEAEPSTAPAPVAGQEPFPDIQRYEPNLVEMRVTTNTDAILILSDLHYAGWRAELDGASVPLLRANYCMRAVTVPAGEHTVIFKYQPSSFRAGLAVSGASLLALLLLVLFARRRPPMSSKESA